MLFKIGLREIWTVKFSGFLRKFCRNLRVSLVQNLLHYIYVQQQQQQQ
jgi:hypothetical protein